MLSTEQVSLLPGLVVFSSERPLLSSLVGVGAPLTASARIVGEGRARGHTCRLGSTRLLLSQGQQASSEASCAD